MSNETHDEQEAPTTAVATTENPMSVPAVVAARGIDRSQWNSLCRSVFPGAHPNSVLMVIDYCKARGLDPMKKPVHIVPMKVKVGEEYVWRDVVMPGIYEYRTTAHRTGKYAGHSKPEFGPEIEFMGVKAPEWISMEIYRLSSNGQKIAFPVTVYFREVVGTTAKWTGPQGNRTKQEAVNDRWTRAPRQMMTKCCEAAGLREAFPEEFGGEHTAEESDTTVIDGEVVQHGASSMAEEEDYLGALPSDEQAEIQGLMTAAKLTAGQTSILLKKHANKPAELKKELAELAKAAAQPPKNGGKPESPKPKAQEPAKPKEEPAVKDATPDAGAVFGGAKETAAKKSKPRNEPDIDSL